MELVRVLVAAAAAFGAGAFYYSRLSGAWMAAAGVSRGADGRPAGAGKGVYVLAIVMEILVAGLMRHILSMTGLTSLIGGLMVGFGLGAFIVAPFLALNYAFAGRRVTLTLIDGGHAIIACSVIGLVLQIL